MWPNTDKTGKILRSIVKPSDKILAESESALILALYDVDKPTNISTFNWLEYRHNTGEKAYIEAVNDGYFNYIELLKDNVIKDAWPKKISSIVKKHINQNYTLTYSTENSEIYKRIY